MSDEANKLPEIEGYLKTVARYGGSITFCRADAAVLVSELRRLRADLKRAGQMDQISAQESEELMSELARLRAELAARDATIAELRRTVDMAASALDLIRTDSDGKRYDYAQGRTGSMIHVSLIVDHCRAMLAAAPPPAAAQGQDARDAVDGWISCADRMPATDELVLVYVPAMTPAPIIEIDNWAERCESPVPWSSATISTGYHWAEFEPEDVTHWRPLPAPPIAADAAKVKP